MKRMPMVLFGRSVVLWSVMVVAVVSACYGQSTEIERKFRDHEFLEQCRSASADTVERVAVLGNVEAVGAIVARNGGRTTVRTASVTTVLASIGVILKLAASHDVVSIVHGYKEFGPPLHRINYGDDSTAALPYVPLSLVDVDPQQREYALRTGDIEDVRNVREPLDRRYDGSGVLVAIIEDGVLDFRHPDFLNADGTTRFVSIWDQTRNGGPLPVYGYGTIWTPDDLNREIRGETHRYAESPRAVEHVTAVAGVAAGSGRATGRYSGVAPGARLIQVSIIPTEANLIEAVAYIFSVADSLGMPCVVNMSRHIAQNVSDGSNIASIAISEMVREKPGRIFVVAAGNNGHIRRHLRYDGRNGGGSRRYWLRCSPSKRQYGIDSEYVHFIRAGNNDMAKLRLSFGALFYNDTVSVRAEPTEIAEYSLDDLVRRHRPCFVVRQGKPYDTLFAIKASAANLTDTTTVVELRITDIYSASLAASHDTGGDMSAPRSDLQSLVSITIAGNGVYEAWSEFFLMVIEPGPSASSVSDYLLPDNLRTIDSPADGDEVLAVGAYINAIDFVDRTGRAIRDTSDFEGNAMYPGKIYSTTQPGGKYQEVWKPLVVTPGIEIAAAIPVGLLHDDETEPNSRLYGGLHRLFGGTSAAAPILAGAAALFLQKYPMATSEEFRQALAQTSYADGETGSVPNPRVGYGKLDLFRLLCWTPGRTPRSMSIKE